MIMLLNPLLEGLQAARNAAPDAIHPDDEVTADDQGDHWVFEFIPTGDMLGGGVRVLIAKDDFRVLKVIYSQ
jgi:hypothetical protein